MKNIIKITDLIDLSELYHDGVFVYEDCGDRSLEYLLEHYGEGDATGYVFTAELIYQACGLPESATLPKDTLYLAVVPNKKLYENHTLISLVDLIWRYSNLTGINMLEGTEKFQFNEQLYE